MRGIHETQRYNGLFQDRMIIVIGAEWASAWMSLMQLLLLAWRRLSIDFQSPADTKDGFRQDKKRSPQLRCFYTNCGAME